MASVLLRIIFLADLMLVQHDCYSNGELVYVTPTSLPNPDCPEGMPCQTLQHHFNNASLTEQRFNLTMIFLSGQHAGVCNRTVLMPASLTLMGVNQGVIINCTNVELRRATKIRIEYLVIDQWYILSLRPPVLVLLMTSVVAQNMSQIYIEHSSDTSGNFIGLTGCIFSNDSSLSGVLYFIKNEPSVAAMRLTSSNVNVQMNTSISFLQNRMLIGALYLNSSVLNVEGNVHLVFFNNERAMTMVNSTLIAGSKANMNNSAHNSVGGAMLVINSTMKFNTKNYLYFADNSASMGGAIAALSSIIDIRCNGKISFINNFAYQGGAMAVVGSAINFRDNAETIQDSKLNIENQVELTFVSNVAYKFGAMAIVKSTVTLRSNSGLTFVNNLAISQIGTIAAVGSNLTLENNTTVMFVNNSANTRGAMAVTLSILNITYSTSISFINNVGLGLEGAFSVHTSQVNLENDVSMTFINNSAFEAGAFSLMSSYLYLMFDTNITFVSNRAVTVGGAMMIHSSQFIIGNATSVTLQFISNSAQLGGAMALLSSTLLFVFGNSNITFVKILHWSLEGQYMSIQID